MCEHQDVGLTGCHVGDWLPEKGTAQQLDLLGTRIGRLQGIKLTFLLTPLGAVRPFPHSIAATVCASIVSSSSFTL